MKKKLFSIILAALFILTSLTTLPTLGIKIDESISIYEIKTSGYEDEKKTSEYWALLVAPFDPHSHKDAFMYCAKLFKNVLLSSGWKESNIITLFDKQPSISNFSNAVDFIARNINPSDTLIVFLSSHGSIGYFGLYEQSISYKKIDTELDKINCAGIGVVISACRSGSAIPHLKQDDRIIITACRADEASPGIDWRYAIGSNEFGDFIINGGDNNGVVSLVEGFNYINEGITESSMSHPQIQDDYFGELNFAPLNWSNGRVDQFSLDATNPYNRTSELWIGWGNKSEAAQSFIPSFDILTKIRLLMTYYNFNELSSLTFSIRNNLTGNNIASITLNASKIQPINKGGNQFNGYVTIDFPDIDVIPGEKYYIVCNTSVESQENLSILWHGRKNDAYEKGEGYESEDNGETWVLSNQSADLFFITYGKNETSNFPPYVSKRPCGMTKGEIDKNYSYCVSTTDADGDMVYYKFDWGDGTFSDWLGPFYSAEIVCIDYSWKNEGIYYVKVKSRDEYFSESDWSDSLKVIIDETPPNIRIIKPEKALYICNIKARRYLIRNALIIGDINIEIESTDEISKIKSVKIYIDDELKANFTSEPYNFSWKNEKRTIFKHRHIVRIVAFDDAGNSATRKFVVWKFL